MGEFERKRSKNIWRDILFYKTFIAAEIDQKKEKDITFFIKAITFILDFRAVFWH